MMKAVLKTLVVSFGGGVALGAGIRLAQGAKSRQQQPPDLDPLVSRLKNVETRIVAMEARAAAPAQALSAASTGLAAFESRLATQVADVEQLRGQVRRVDERLHQLDNQIPAVVESIVDVRFQEVEHKLRQDFEEAQNRSIAAFVETLQTRVIERMNTLEANLSEQSQAIGKLRDTSLRTDENLQKMLRGIERLVEQSRPPETPPAPPSAPVTSANLTPSAGIDTQVEHAAAPVASAAEVDSEAVSVTPMLLSSEPVIGDVDARCQAAAEPSTLSTEPPENEESYEWLNRIGLELLAPRPKARPGWYLQLVLGTAGGLVLLGGLFYSGILQRYFESPPAEQTSSLVSTAPSAAGEMRSRDRLAPRPADLAALVEKGREYARRQDWVRAEAAYRAAFNSSPGNREAATGLSDVLYQEQKYEESAAVLNRLASINSQN